MIQILIAILGVAVVIVVYGCSLLSSKYKTAFISSCFGVVLMVGINLTSSITSVGLEYNFFNSAVCVVLGAPGALTLFLISSFTG